MAIEDYLAALFGGQTGTNDPARAGWSFPSLIGSAQAAEPSRPGVAPFGRPAGIGPDDIARLLQSQQSSPPPPAGGDSSMVHGAPAYSPPSFSGMFQGAFGRSPAQAMQNGLFGTVPPPPIPGPFSDQDGGGGAPAPPPIPGPMPQPGGAKILARLYNPEPIQAPGGDDISRIVNLIGPQSGPYAAMQQTARNAQMGGQPPAAAPIPQQAPQQQPAAPSLGASAPVAAPRTLSRADQMEASQHFQFQAPPSTKPGFYDNLLRFGLAAMAAGGKPGSNTLGALGEAGLSTFDNNQKAGQTDFENSLASRKLYYTGQDIINKRLEQAEALQVRADSIKENNATKLQLGRQAAEARQDALDMKASIASGNQALVQQKIEEIQRENASKDADRADKTEDRRTAETRRRDDLSRQTERDANQAFAKSFGEIQKDMNSVGLTLDQKQFRARQEAAYGNPGSNQDQIYQQKAAQLRAQAQAAAAAGKPKAQVNKMLQDYGLEVLP